MLSSQLRIHKICKYLLLGQLCEGYYSRKLLDILYNIISFTNDFLLFLAFSPSLSLIPATPFCPIFPFLPCLSNFFSYRIIFSWLLYCNWWHVGTFLLHKLHCIQCSFVEFVKLYGDVVDKLTLLLLFIL